MHTNPDSGQAEQTKVGFQELASREEEARRLSFSKNIDGKSREKKYMECVIYTESEWGSLHDQERIFTACM